MEHTHRRPSFAWPLLLILAGVGFLLTNLGFIGGDFWSFLALYWPVLFIIFALDNIWQGEGIAGAILGIGIGVIFLMSNLGYLNVSIWDIVVRFWPLLIIAAGLDVLIGRRGYRGWLGALAGLAVVGGLALGVFWLSRNAAQPVQGTTQEINQAGTDVSELETRLNMIAGNLDIQGSSQGSNLVAGTIVTQRGERFDQDFHQAGKKAVLTLGIDGVTVGPFNTRTGSGDWDLTFSSDVLTSLDINLIAGQLMGDLSELQISGLKSNVIFGQTIIELPEGSKFDGDISTLVGDSVVRVPRGSSVAINADSLIGTVVIPDGFTRDGDWVYSPGANKGSADIELEVDTLIGKVEIQEIP